MRGGAPAPSAGSTARFAGVSLAGLGGVAVAGLVFAVLLGLVVASWPPLQRLDVAVVEAVNRVVSGNQAVVSVLHLVTDLGGVEASFVLLPVAVVWLLVRRAPRLAVYVAATGLGLAVLVNGIKTLVGRLRPLVDVPIASAPNESFPSGHAMGSTVTYGVLLLVFGAAVPARFRRALTVAVVTLVVAVGLSRIGLAVHYPSDVVAGWMLGLLWLTVTTTAFHRWLRVEEPRTGPFGIALLPETREAHEAAPAGDDALPRGWRSVTILSVAAVLTWGSLLGLGFLVTDVLDPVRGVDAAVVDWLASIRSDGLTDVLVAIGHLGGTTGIVAVLVASSLVSLAVTRRWVAPLLLVVATGGQTLMYLATSAVVARERPAVEHLGGALPPTGSYPSGHAAAATATYGAAALLVLAWSRSRLRLLAPAAAVLVVTAVAVSRVYRGAHHPTDVLVGVLYAAVWLAVVWLVLRPSRGAPTDRGSGDRADAGSGDAGAHGAGPGGVPGRSPAAHGRASSG